MEVIAFDVFDTLLTRQVGLPRHIFLLTGIQIQKQLNLDLEPEVFANARGLAEAELVKQGEISSDIYAIYRKLARQLDISQELTAAIAEIELNVEFQEIISVEKNVLLLNQMRSAGHQIVYISDMYLGSSIIRKLLRRHGIYRKGEKIYVSCEYGVAKGSGELFAKVLDDLGIDKQHLHHYGNSRKADIKGADKAGISATYLPECNLNRYEKYLCGINGQYRPAAGQTLHYSRLAAASRLARLQCVDEKQQIYDVACSVAAPVLYRFVSQVLEESEGKRIYFLARDGLIMYKIAEQIIEAKGYESEIKYLYISREALALARYTEQGAGEYFRLIRKIYAYESLSYLFDLFSITDELLFSAGLENLDLTLALSKLPEKEYYEIMHHEMISKQVRNKSMARKKVLIDYLNKEGVFDGSEIAIVDTGWYLTIQNLLADLFKERGAEPPEGYYFGINESANSSVRNGKKKGYFWDWRREGNSINIMRLSYFLEIICPPMHGRTIDYRYKNGDVVPVFDSHESVHLKSWGIEDLESGILNAVKWMLRPDENFSGHATDRDILLGLAKIFWCLPGKAEIEVWGRYPFVITRDGKKVFRLFKQSTYLNTLRYVLKKGKLPNSRNDYWPYAHIYSLNTIKRTSIRYSMMIKRRMHHLRRNRVFNTLNGSYKLTRKSSSLKKSNIP